MAEPLILAFGRGELPEFPAAPDSVVDIVPVDHVVGAIIARDGAPAGARRRRLLPRLVRRPQPAALPAALRAASPSTSTGTRSTCDERGAVRLPNWRFPGADKVERLLSQGERAHRMADRALGLAPRSDRVR